MEERIEKNDGLTVESLQAQVRELRAELAKAVERGDQFRSFWMNTEAERDAARDLLKSVKTLVAAIEIEPSFK